jgi:excisionase family DNA binding protein
MAPMTSKTDSLPTFHSIKEIARHCRVCERTVLRWIQANELAVHRLGRRVLISEEDFARFLAARRA